MKRSHPPYITSDCREVKYSSRRCPLVHGHTRDTGAQPEEASTGARLFAGRALAHRAKIDRTYISSLERSIYAAGIDVVDRLGRALGVEAEDLLRRPTAEHGERKKRTPTKR